MIILSEYGARCHLKKLKNINLCSYAVVSDEPAGINGSLQRKGQFLRDAKAGRNCLCVKKELFFIDLCLRSG